MFGPRKIILAFLALNVTFVLCQEDAESPNLNDDSLNLDQTEGSTEINSSPTSSDNGSMNNGEDTTVFVVSPSWDEDNATANELTTDGANFTNSTETSNLTTSELTTSELTTSELTTSELTTSELTTKFDLCDPNPCLDGGTCTKISDDEVICNCTAAYTGKYCEMAIDDCTVFPDSCDGVCAYDGGTASWECKVCSTGTYWDYQIMDCRTLDMCPLMRCDIHEICKDNVCDCEHGFERNNITDKCEPNFCATIGCQTNNSICTESTDGNPENFQCYCPKGKAVIGNQCTYIWCEFPSLNECEQKCTTVNDEYTCSCFDNFKLKNDSRTCEFTGGEVSCVNTTCKNGLCVKEKDKERCVCPLGYIEENEVCIDLCSAKQLPDGVCPDNMCESVENIGFRCQCTGKYQLGADGMTCTLKKMCLEGEVGQIQCEKQNAVCIDDPGKTGFKCICSPGFAPTDTGYCKSLCEFNEIDAMCSKLGALCDVDYKRVRVCRCPIGFKKVKKGSPCNILAENSYLINLPVDYDHYRTSIEMSKDAKGVHLVTMDYSQLEHDVTESAKVLFPDFVAANIVKCKMQKGYLLCTVELQFEETTLEKLTNMTFPSFCHYNNTISIYRCLVLPALVLRVYELKSQVTIAKTNICNADIKKEICGTETTCTKIDNGKNFVCSCKNGYKVRSKSYPIMDTKSYIEDCNDIDECEDNPCPKSTICVNTMGNFDCNCLAGYRLKDNNTDPKNGGCVELCTPTNPCTHGECSKTSDHTFGCSCSTGYKGALCDLEDRSYKDAKMNTVIVGAVLGGILLITSLLFVSSITRYRKKKYLKESEQILYTAEMTERHPIRLGTPNRNFQADS